MSDKNREWREEFRVAGKNVGDRVRELVREGNARRIIIKKPNGDVIREISLTRGVAIGGMLALIAPALAAIGAVVALLSEVRIEVVREAPRGEEEGSGPDRADQSDKRRPGTAPSDSAPHSGPEDWNE